MIPFNGVLVTRELVERIGYPRAEFFIWGDDVEYLWRAEAAGARIATVVDAHVLHPATDDLGTPMMFGRTTYNHSPSDLKHYCMARNNTVNLRALPGLAARADVLGQDACGSTCSPSREPRPAPDERPGGVRRAARRLHRPPEVPRGDRAPRAVAVVVVTYNRAALLTRMLAGLAALDRAPDAVIVVDNASTDHTATVLDARRRPAAPGDPARGEPRRRGRLPRWASRRPTSRASTGSG